MFKPIRRKKSELTKEQALEIVKNTTYGVLATVNQDNHPRTVALNHVLIDENTILFHGATQGEKVENMKHNPHVSYFVVESETIVKEEFTTRYKSASIQGKMELIEDEKTKFDYLVKLGQAIKTDASVEEIHDYTYPSRIGKVMIYLLHIEDIKGKSNIK
jgi:nitroimidazol reductase NimA-like FMN-containing flavoprotein (pyridoxamine 5'-phosphate oxidase superfamily)